jgi:hypothetical protein
VAARTWFTKASTDGLDDRDLATLNRAARIYLSGTSKADLSCADLSRLRLAFRFGVSAQEIANAVHDDDELVFKLRRQ